MNKQAHIAVRVNPNLKRRCEEVFYRLGMNTNAGIKLFLSQMTLYQCLPFELTLDEHNQDMFSDEKTVSLVFNVDADIKRKCSELAAAAGLNLSLMIKLYMVQVVDKNGIPFPVISNERV